MARRFYDLPTLTSLAAFEAAARHQNFSLASAELNVTPGALSRQIKSLEQELDAVLLNRSASGVLLTADGIAIVEPGKGWLQPGATISYLPLRQS